MDCFNSWPLVLRRACSPVICIWIASVVMAWSEALKAATVITWHYRWCGVMPVGGPYRRQPSYLSIGGLNVTCIIYIIYTQNLGLYIKYIYMAARIFKKPCATLCRGPGPRHKVPRHKVLRHKVQGTRSIFWRTVVDKKRYPYFAYLYVNFNRKCVPGPRMDIFLIRTYVLILHIYM
jgi:hypothetical protein